MRNQSTVWILGPYGKMGTALRDALEDTNDFVVTGLISPNHDGEKCEVAGRTITVVSSCEDMTHEGDYPDVIVDFSIADASYESALFAARNNINFVSGTTGCSKEQQNSIIKAFKGSKAHAIIASNFSIGAVLMMRFAREAAPHFTHAEIIETHHIDKKDTPSGTSKSTQLMMAENSTLNIDDIHIHSVRLPGAIAHQQVCLSVDGEILRIEHDANNRSCFMPGVLLSMRNVSQIDGILFSIESLLFEAEK